MARLDAHQHFWRYSPKTHGWINDKMAVIRRDFLPDDLAPLLKKRGYDGCVAVQAEQNVKETSWLLDLADKHAFIKGVVGWVDLLSADVVAGLTTLAKRKKLRGVRHIVQGEPDDFMRRPDFQRGIAALAPFGLTYDILVYHRQLPAALALAEKFPKQRFVVDHVAKPDIKRALRDPWTADMRALAKHQNVYCKVSGMVTEADYKTWTPAQLQPYLEVVFEAFGPERLMIGSDWPVCLVAADYDRTMSVVEDYVAKLPKRAQEAVLGGTASRFYGI